MPHKKALEEILNVKRPDGSYATMVSEIHSIASRAIAQPDPLPEIIIPDISSMDREKEIIFLWMVEKFKEANPGVNFIYK